MNSESLNNKVVLVSGSSMGIGKAIALEMARVGAKVVLNGRDEKRLANTKAELKGNGYDVLAVVADIRDPEACKYLIKETLKGFGRLDVLINNAGISSRGAVENTVNNNFNLLMETNYTGSAYLSKYAIAPLKITKGSIVFINSAGGFRGMPFNSFYTASKMAQAALADALRIELFDFGIHIGVVFVGFTENDPKKVILNVEGNWVYLPKRTNVKLAKPETVASSVRRMVEKRKKKVTLTNLGRLANFMVRYFPDVSNWILLINRKKIREEYTDIGGLPLKKGD